MEQVIFDTNAYRHLTALLGWKDIETVMTAIHNKEKEAGIEPLMSSIVGRELLAHVADKNDPSYLKCLKAAKAMYLHNGNDEVFRMIANVEQHIAKYFFRVDCWKKAEDTNNVIAGVLFQISKAKNTTHIRQRNQKTLGEIRNYVHSTEKVFADYIYKVIRMFDPDGKEWRISPNNSTAQKAFQDYIKSDKCPLEWALAHVIQTYKKLVADGEIHSCMNYNMSQLVKMAEQYVKMFPASLKLYEFVLNCCCGSDFDMTKDSRVNFIWDILILCNANEHTLQGNKLYLVTQDKQMGFRAEDAGLNYSVISYNDYMDLLGLPEFKI